MTENHSANGGRLLVDCLIAQGCDRIFTVPGESFLAVLDALHDSPEVQTVICRQEGGAAMMADCWGRLTGEPGVCFVTRGPGATNAVTGIATKEGNRDDDGNASGVVSFISDEQVEELTALITETKTDIAKFLEIGKVESLSDITTADFGKAKALLLSKKKKDVSK